jgi:hypothetical protein
MFIAESQIRPLAPVVTGISPAHDAKEVSPVAPIAIHFNKPMDTESVERAFSITPRVKGAFSWSATRDEMTFTPKGRGFKAQSMVAVRLGDTARDAISGQAFYARFESRYCCGASNLHTIQLKVAP